MFPYLSVAIFLPLLTGLIVICLPSNWTKAIRGISMAGAVLTFLVVSQMTWLYSSGVSVDQVPELKTADVFYQDRVREIRADALEQLGGTSHPLASWFNEAKLGQVENPTRRTDLDTLGKPYGESSEEAALQRAGVWEAYLAARENQLAANSPFAKHTRFVESYVWIGRYNINYAVGGDGLSLPLIWLSALLTILCLAYSWHEPRGTKAFFALFLLLETALIGVFAALDFFLFYIFWEIVLLPMYFLIGFWGGPRRIYAAIKFFIYTLVGSVLMLIAMIALYLQVDPQSFNILTLTAAIPQMKIGGGLNLAWLGGYWTFKDFIFFGMFIAFAIKVPVFPFHTWLPDAHVQAPTAGSVALAGVLLKMGGYGIFRFCYAMVPNEACSQGWLFFVAILGMLGIVYGALCAMAQKDFKSLVAYSSVSHMGYVLLGVAACSAAGVMGAVLQMFTHGLSSAMMFLLVGVIYDRAHHRNLDDFGGIGLQMPYYTGLATVGFFAALGLPGLCGFISEALVFVGAWHNQGAYAQFGMRWIVLVSLLGIVFGAAYILWTIQRVFMGGLPSKYKNFPDLDAREWFCLTPLALLCLIVGVCPWIIIDYMEPTVNALFEVMNGALPAPAGP